MAALVLAQGKDSRYSHVGMLIKTADTWSVVHSIPPEPGVAGGVHAIPLDSFASPEVAAQVAFFRVTDLAKPLQIKAKEYLVGQIGKPFDYRFEFSDDSAHYCTELVVKALRNAEIDLEPSLARVHVIGLSEAALLPDSLSGSPRLRELTASVPHAAIDLKLSH